MPDVAGWVHGDTTSFPNFMGVCLCLQKVCTPLVDRNITSSLLRGGLFKVIFSLLSFSPSASPPSLQNDAGEASIPFLCFLTRLLSWQNKGQTLQLDTETVCELVSSGCRSHHAGAAERSSIYVVFISFYFLIEV